MSDDDKNLCSIVMKTSRDVQKSSVGVVLVPRLEWLGVELSGIGLARDTSRYRVWELAPRGHPRTQHITLAHAQKSRNNVGGIQQKLHDPIHE